MNKKYPITYAVKHKNEKVVMNSRSGGVFTSISDYVLSINGKVYGAILNDKFEVEHIGTNTKEIRDKMRGSKYVQSNLKNVFNDIKKDLQNGVFVLFTGTPCQVAGLKNFLNKKYDNLLTVDIVCHGVPSPLVFEKYVEWQQKCNHDKLKTIDFRNKKKFGWRPHYETLFFDKKQIDSFVYKNLFQKLYAIRPSCFKCPFKSINRVGNISIADYWGIENIDHNFNDNKGTSLVIINDIMGEEIFKKINKSINILETKIEDSIQPALQYNYEKPKEYEMFWDDLEKINFSKIAIKYADYTLKNRIKFKLKKIIKK